MNDDFEERLRAYGRTIDEATESDLVDRAAKTDGATASSLPRWRQWRTRPLVAGVVLAVVAAIAVIAVVASAQGPSDHVNVRGSTPTTPTTYYCDPNGGDTPTCPEEGPPLTPQQKAQFAEWRSEYDPAEVAFITRGDPGADDVAVVETMEYRLACRATFSALHAAQRAIPTKRSSAVSSIMQPELARYGARNWPPQSQGVRQFTKLAERLESGDLSGVKAEFDSGLCRQALQFPPSVTTSTSLRSRPTTSPGVVVRCQSSQLRLARGVRFSEPTGQHTLSLTLTNISGSPCSLFGYPGIRIVDGNGRVLPFVYADHGDQVVSPRAPIPVTLAPGAKAYITINKYRCDLGDKIIAGELSVTPPGDSDALSVALRPVGIGMNYCGPGDPGSKIYVSRAATTLNGTLAH